MSEVTWKEKEGMTIWVFAKPSSGSDKNFTDGVHKELLSGRSRFGWSWDPKAYDERSRNGSGFLNDVKIGDIVVHVSVPEYGLCTAARVTGNREFKGITAEDISRHILAGDFGSCIPVDTGTIIKFDRNDSRLPGAVRNSLKPRGRFQRCYSVEKFLGGIQDIRDNVKVEGDGRLHHTRKAITPCLEQVSELISENYERKALEPFLAKVLENVPCVSNVVPSGQGWGTDHGADIIFDINNDFENPRRAVAQVKSYKGEHWSPQAVNDIKKAFETYQDAEVGIIFTTAKSTPGLEEAVEELEASYGGEKSVKFFAGKDLAAFVLKFYGKELFD